jgi:hypothetical protein
VAGCCERGNGPSGSIKGAEFLDSLSHYWLLKKEEMSRLAQEVTLLSCIRKCSVRIPTETPPITWILVVLLSASRQMPG